MAVVASSIQWPTVQEEVKRLLAIHGTMVMEVGSFRRLTGAHHRSSCNLLTAASGKEKKHMAAVRLHLPSTTFFLSLEIDAAVNLSFSFRTPSIS